MILIGNGRVITNDNNNTFIENGCIAIEGNMIKEVGETSKIKYKYANKYDEFIDAKEKLIMPGMINTHHHIYSAFARGLDLKNPPAETFTDILKNVWWRIDKKLSLEDIRYSAYTTLIECIKNGVTTIFDHHSSPMSVEGSLFAISNVADELGIRGCYCYEVSDRDGQRILKQGINENIDFIKYANEKEDDMTKGMFGMHASFTLSNESLEKCREAMDGIDAGYHIHVSEGIEDLKNSLICSGKRTVERLFDYGILGEKTIASHCIHVNKYELDILKETNTSVVNNPESNMANAVGVAPVIKMIDKGIRIGLGTDGYTSDMFESMKVENIINKHNLCNSNVGFMETAKMIFNNKEIVSKYYNKPLGVLEDGAYADVIVVDYNPMTPMDKNNYFGHILFGVSGRSVDTTVINGKVVMKDRVIVNIDEELIYKKARQVAEKLWKKL
ncbi:putative aminohydrolase SsnA [Clostridium sp.]|uniref:putative aminohydrolase SsnA n=1 Tax=Clostridium sp. TaxID=1506 RepID=UPI003522D026